jgi:hypothetical protein
MEPDALLHPRGPLPPGVYWRRRGLTLLAVVVVLFLLSKACGSDGSPSARVSQSPAPRTTAPVTPRPSKPPTAKPSASASATTDAAAGPCAAKDLALSARADADVYTPARRPRLTIGIANKGTKPCTRDLGQGARQIVITSGNDRVWSSDDCSPGGGSQVVTLLPGAAPTTFTVTWARKRSAPGCPPGMRDAEPGTYRMRARFGDLTSSEDGFSLTG